MNQIPENKTLSCGILIVDKANRVLMFDVDKSDFWDIPKGGHETGETPVETALRELTEETSLISTADQLIELGVYPYNLYKDLYLFIWFVEDIPIERLLGENRILKRPGAVIVDEQIFAMVPIEKAPDRMCKSLYWLFISQLEKEIESELSRKPKFHKVTLYY